MYVCFVLDTNPSMGIRPAPNADSALSLSALDMAKCSIEKMLSKLKSMGLSNVIDRRVLLLQSRVDPIDGCVLAAAGSDLSAVDVALKGVSCSAMPHSLAHTLAVAFDLLGKYRTCSGVDFPGRGLQLSPSVLEQAFVLVLTNDLLTLVGAVCWTAVRQCLCMWLSDVCMSESCLLNASPCPRCLCCAITM